MKAVLAFALLLVSSRYAVALERGQCTASEGGMVLDTQNFDERTILNVSLNSVIVIDSDDVTPNLEVWTASKTEFMKDPTGANAKKLIMVMGGTNSTFSTSVGDITVTCRN